jgi:DNA-binding NtrC family response regulator
MTGECSPVKPSRTVLVVDDEEDIKEAVRRILVRDGYTVLVAGSPAEALVVSDNHPERIDLLLTDAVMPGMSGRELAEQLVEARGGCAVLYTSGYPQEVAEAQGIIEENAALLEKPFTRETLLVAVRATLAASVG